MIRVSEKAMQALFEDSRYIKYKTLIYLDDSIIDVSDDVIAIIVC